MDTGTTFRDYVQGSISFADVDGDNDQDLVITGNSITGNSSSKLYRNSATVGIFESINEKGFNIYPNPTTSQITLNTTEKIESVNFIDITGKILKTITKNTNIIDVSELKNGVYIVQVISDKGMKYSKFIKK